MYVSSNTMYVRMYVVFMYSQFHNYAVTADVQERPISPGEDDSLEEEEVEVRM